MKRPLFALLLFCLLAGSLAWRLMRERGQGDVVVAPAKAPELTAQPASDGPMKSEDSPVRAPMIAAPRAAGPAIVKASPPAASDEKTGPRYKRAYLLSIDKGELALVEAQDIEGDFAPRRGKQEEWSNMLRFRLMSETNTVLAEELQPAPDQACHVLDPRAADGKAVNFTTPGPVIFQVRLPRVKGARRLDIFRILEPGEPTIQNLLGSLALPPS